MFSPRKKQDKELLLEIAEMIETLVKVGTPQALDIAEQYGEYYEQLAKRIQTHDYTQQDKNYYVIHELLC